jgi:hypothetical protein
MNPQFSLKINLNNVEYFPLQGDDWSSVQERILVYIIIKFFKQYPSAFLEFLTKYSNRHKNEIMQQLEKSETERKKKRKPVIDKAQREVTETLENGGRGRDYFRKMLLRPEEGGFMDFNDNGDIVPPPE